MFVGNPHDFAEPSQCASATSKDWLRFRLIHRKLEKPQEPVATESRFGVNAVEVTIWVCSQRSENLEERTSPFTFSEKDVFLLMAFSGENHIICWQEKSHTSA